MGPCDAGHLRSNLQWSVELKDTVSHADNIIKAQ